MFLANDMFYDDSTSFSTLGWVFCVGSIVECRSLKGTPCCVDAMHKPHTLHHATELLHGNFLVDELLNVAL